MEWTASSLGPEYIIPKPFDPRVLVWEASAVGAGSDGNGSGEDACGSDGIPRTAGKRLLGKAHEVMRLIIHQGAEQAAARGVPGRRTRENPAGGAHPGGREQSPHPILLGDERIIGAKAKDLGVGLEKIEVVNPQAWPKREAYINTLYELRQRHGVTLSEAHELINKRNLFGSMMVHLGDADALVAGVGPALPGHHPARVAGDQTAPGCIAYRVCTFLVTRRGDMLFSWRIAR